MKTETLPSQNGTAKEPATVKNLLARDDIQKRFREILGEKAPGFISSVLNVVNGNSTLANAEPNSVIMSAAVAATLDLPINPNLGFAYIIGYNQKYQDNGQWKQKQVAQFQMGYKGFIQLAMRTGQYKKINAIEVKAGQLGKFNPLTEEFEFDFTKEGKEVVGYVAYFQLINGFEKTVYWNVAKINEHAKRYSKSFNNATSPWKTNYPEMALKTLLKYVLSKFGILSIEMQKAVQVDQGVVKDHEGTVIEYPDQTIEDANHTEVTSETDETTGNGPGNDNAGANQSNVPNSSEL